MHIHATFDSGNIEVVDASDPLDVQLVIRPDEGGNHLQWFHFRVTGALGEPVRLRIVNAAKASYPKAWEGYRAVVSEDRATWRRCDTAYEGGELVITHTLEAHTVWFAYFAPYDYERHQALIGECQAAEGVSLEVLGDTVDGRPMDLLTFGEGVRVIWVIARQHPGESMAEWWMEGFLARMLDPDDALARHLRTKARFCVVPNMNPDGSIRGHLRNNAAGANLNREWHEPTLERSPEVKLVRDRMDATGVDLCLDVHGDEELPYNFFSGAEGIPGWSSRLKRLQDAFVAAYIRANPDMQDQHGYPVAGAGAANLTMCTNQVAQRFDCLSLTLEQPFKDNANAPDEEQGWSPTRCERLGASAVDAMAAVIDALR